MAIVLVCSTTPPVRSVRCIAPLLVLTALLLNSAVLPAESSAADPVLTESEQWQLLSVLRSSATVLALQDLPVLLEGGTTERLHLQVRAADRWQLDAASIAYVIIEADLAASRPLPASGRGLEYHTSEQVSARMRELADLYPLLARTIDLGRSWQGRELTGMLITDQPWTRELDEPSLRVLGAHHGDEWSSMEVSLDLIEALLASYSNEPALAAMVDGAELWFLPVVNPDGVAAYSRRNSRGVDLNRNYSYRWQPGPYSGDSPFSEVEADAVRALAMTRSFFHSLSVHSGASNLGWVWNYTTEPAPDAAFMEAACQDYLDANEQAGFWITNGAEWYITYGDTNDWSYGVRGGHDYTLEVSVDRSPPAELLDDLLAYHRQPSLDFLSAGFQAGVQGRVTDTLGDPIEAQVQVDGFDTPSYCDPETGVFARPLQAGSYELTLSSPGHESETIGIQVNGDQASIVDVQLQANTTVPIDQAIGLEANVEVESEATLCGANLIAALGSEGRVLAHRPGLGGPYDLSWLASATSPEHCIVVSIDPEQIGEPWQREGEWHLLFAEESGETIAQLPLGLLLVSSQPGYQIDSVALSGPTEMLRIQVDGLDLPEGAAIRLIGPSGHRELPSLRLPGDTSSQIAAQFDASDWVEGLWSLRVFGRGHWSAVSEAIVVKDGIISPNPDPTTPAGPLPEINQPKGPPPGADQDTPEEDQRDGLAAGCACALSSPADSSAFPLALVLMLMIGYFLRRSPPHATS